MSNKVKTPVDQPVRDRLSREFGKNFLVEAGAGSGKTYSLATRMAAGIAAGVYSVEHVAVVTFTRKAAAELRGRFQLALEERLRDQPSAEQRQRLEAALAGMERLAAGTIHSFCARLLRERPVDAGIAPGFDELSDVDNLRRRQQAWRDFVAEAAASGSKPMLDLLEAGIKPADLDEAFAAVCEHEDVEFDLGSGEAPDAKPHWRAIEAFWKQVCALRPPEFHPDTTCKLQKRFDEFDGRLRNARRRQTLPALAAFVGAWGSMGVIQMYWGEKVDRPKEVGKQVAALVNDFNGAVIEPFQAAWRAYVHHLAMQVLTEARQFYADDRRRQNVVNYVDLLRVSAEMLRRSPLVRHALQQKYRVLFIDEFQDTDPIQAEIFLMLAAAEPGDGGTPEAAAPPVDPYALALRPGALFVVGDPKQSIFRFRRADIDIYNRVAERIRQTGGEVVTLTANFRSLPGVCAVANTVFPGLFAGLGAPYSPPFAPLDAVHEEDETTTACTATITIPDEDDGVKHEVKESRRIAAYIKSQVDAGRRTYGDFLVLTRQTPRLRIFVNAFDELHIPVDVSGAGLFCQSPEVKVLAGLLRSLADPLDSVALVGVLRGRLFGHSDPELFQFRQADGRFELSMPLPQAESDAERAALDTKYGPVLKTMNRLRAMWKDTWTLPPAAAVERILDDTGWLALAGTTPGGAPAGHLLQAVDRVREVVGEGGGLAEAADALNEEEKSGESEAMPLEPGRRNVVRLMNLHKAKGLEAPVVILADAAHQFPFPVSLRVVRGEGGARPVGHLRIMRRGPKPGTWITVGQAIGWDEHEQEEKKYAEAERLRLLYVAGTRPRSLLVLCRSSNAKKNRAWNVFDGYFAGAAELSAPDALARVEAAAPLPSSVSELGTQLGVTRAWREQRHAAVGRPSFDVTSVTARDVEAASAFDSRPEPVLARNKPEEAELKAEAQPADTRQRRADAGVAWGSLVHGLLEHAMRHPAATQSDLERLARWLTVDTAELRPAISTALALVETMSKSSVWEQARAGCETHVEAPFAIRLDPPNGYAADMPSSPGAPYAVPVVLRGVVDLVYRADDGWHIVDYKTDLGADEFELQERHRGQLAQYRVAWARVAEGPVVEARIVSAR